MCATTANRENTLGPFYVIMNNDRPSLSNLVSTSSALLVNKKKYERQHAQIVEEEEEDNFLCAFRNWCIARSSNKNSERTSSSIECKKRKQKSIHENIKYEQKKDDDEDDKMILESEQVWQQKEREKKVIQQWFHENSQFETFTKRNLSQESWFVQLYLPLPDTNKDHCIYIPCDISEIIMSVLVRGVFTQIPIEYSDYILNVDHCSILYLDYKCQPQPLETSVALSTSLTKFFGESSQS
jgi:hypothetical protein